MVCILDCVDLFLAERIDLSVWSLLILKSVHRYNYTKVTCRHSQLHQNLVGYPWQDISCSLKQL